MNTCYLCFMHKKWLVTLCFTLLLAFQTKAQEWPTPFTLRLEEATWPEWPGIHSFAHAHDDGRWLVLYGREGGMHAMIPPDPFPIAEANLQVRMLDPETGEFWERSIFELPDSLAFPLRSTNPQFVQQDGYLYVMGGYGKDTTSADFLTFATLVAVNLDLLRNALETGSSMEPAFRLYRDSLFYLSGAEAEIMNDRVYLFGGHEFTGEYTMIGGIGFTQRYTNEVRSFQINDDGTDINISDIQIQYDSILFHRRDLNVAPVVFPGENFGLAAYSGVFQYDANLPWLSDVYMDGSTYWEDTVLSHQFNNYTCPVLGLYDSTSEEMYTVLFGGISQFYFDADDSVLVEDLNVPFTADISCITRQPDGNATQQLLPIRFDELLGSNAVFIPSVDAPAYDNGVLRLHHINGEVFAGYIFGGINAEFMNFTPSAASNRLFKVYVSHEVPVNNQILSTKKIELFPNPASNQLWLNGAEANTPYRIVDVHGQSIQSGVFNGNSIHLGDIPNGIYVITIYNNSTYLITQPFVVSN